MATTIYDGLVAAHNQSNRIYERRRATLDRMVKLLVAQAADHHKAAVRTADGESKDPPWRDVASLGIAIRFAGEALIALGLTAKEVEALERRHAAD